MKLLINLVGIKSTLLVIMSVGIIHFLATHRSIDDSNMLIYTSKYDVKIVGETLQRFKSKVGRYPTTEEGLVYLTESRSSDSNSPYIEELGVDGWGKPLVYRNTSDGAHPFLLYSVGGNGIDENGAGDDIEYWRDSVTKQ
jgi:general secretion pathway protein G